MPQEANRANISLQDRIDSVKAAYQLERFIESSGVPVIKRGSNLWVYENPFRVNDHTPSFKVYVDTQQWVDFGGSGDLYTGDIIDFYQERWNTSFHEALTALEKDAGHAIQNVPPRPQQKKERGPIKEIRLDRVLACANYEDVAMPYWESQGLDHETVHYTLMGADMTGDQMGYPMGHKVETGKRAGTFVSGECKRYTIPDLRPDPKTLRPMVVYVNSRRDNTSAREYIDFMWKAQRDDIQAVCDDLAPRYGGYSVDVPEDKLLDAIFGAKYLVWKPYNQIIFNGSILADWVAPGKVRMRHLQYVIVVEGEKCARNLTASGYPSVGVKPTSKIDLSTAFKSVDQVYYAYDRDDTGDSYALEALMELGGLKLDIPAPHKDPTEVKIAGKLDSWLQGKYSIYPTDTSFAIPEWMRAI